MSKYAKNMTGITRENAAKIIAFLAIPGNEAMGNKEVASALGFRNEAYVRRAKYVYQWGKTMKIPPKRILRDRGTQIRASIDEKVVDEYAELMKSGVIFPPPVVFYDGVNYILGDGFHRVLAAIKAGLAKIEVVVESGDVRAAILYAVGANSTHGLKRTNEDKRRAASVLLGDEEWGRWTDADIARRCGVSAMFVGNMRRDPQYKSFISTERKSINKHGQEVTINVAGRGRPASQVEPESDDEQEAKLDRWNEERAAQAVERQASVSRSLAAVADDDEEYEPEPVAAPCSVKSPTYRELAEQLRKLADSAERGGDDLPDTVEESRAMLARIGGGR